MSTMTREQLRERAREKVKSLEFAVTQTAFADSRPELEEELELARIALASLEAEAVCVIDQSNLDYLNSGSDADVWPVSRTEMGDVLLYRSAPPAPLSVPTFDEWCQRTGQKPLGWVRDVMKEAYEGCASAMLKGAENRESRCTIQTAPKLDSSPKIAESPSGNSPVIPDGWVACSERMPGEVLAALQNVARLRRNLSDFCGDKSVIARCLSEAEAALLNAVNRHSTMLAETQQETKNV